VRLRVGIEARRVRREAVRLFGQAVL